MEHFDTLQFSRYQQSNGSFVYGVRGDGIRYRQFIRDLFKQDFQAVERRGDWFFWTYINHEDEVDFIEAYEEDIFTT